MDTPTPTPDLITTTEVARRLACSRPTVRKLLDDGKLPAHRDARLIRIPRSSVDAYLEQTATGGGRRG